MPRCLLCTRNSSNPPTFVVDGPRQGDARRLFNICEVCYGAYRFLTTDKGLKLLKVRGG